MTISVFLLPFIPCFTGKHMFHLTKKKKKRKNWDWRERREREEKDGGEKEDKGGRKERNEGKEKGKKKSSFITIKIWMELNFSLLHGKEKERFYSWLEDIPKHGVGYWCLNIFP